MFPFALEIVVFLSGAMVMVFELVGSRIVAPFYGSSIFVWTNLIGIILASLSIGYWWGGAIADKNPKGEVLTRCILWAAACILYVCWANEIVLALCTEISPDFRVGAVLATILLFSPASILLGMVSPYAIRLSMEDVSSSGKTVGRLYAISTLGSIFGTFSAGYFFISYFGSFTVMALIAAVLLLAALMVPRKQLGMKDTLLFIFFLVLFLLTIQYGNLGIVERKADLDTQYTRIWITDEEHQETKRPMRALRTDLFTAQTLIYLDDGGSPASNYVPFMRLAEHFAPDYSSTLMLGGGGYVLAREHIKTKDDLTLDVVEIDPGMGEVAKEYFFYEENPRVKLHYEDARTFVNRDGESYDIVFMDVFNSVGEVPFHLTTIEFMRKLKRRIKEEGVIAVNLVSALEGPKGKFFRALYKTYSEVFGEILVFPAKKEVENTGGRNITLLIRNGESGFSLESEDAEIQAMLDTRLTTLPELELPVFTDNYAPAERYLVSVLTES